MQSLLWLSVEADPSDFTAACSVFALVLQVCNRDPRFSPADDYIIYFNVDNTDYIMITVFHSHTCRGSKIDMEQTQNDGEIPTKVSLGASYK